MIIAKGAFEKRLKDRPRPLVLAVRQAKQDLTQGNAVLGLNSFNNRPWLKLWRLIFTGNPVGVRYQWRFANKKGPVSFLPYD